MTTKTKKRTFSEEQKELLDNLDPYIDMQLRDSRKGEARSNPVITLTADDCYWDDTDKVYVPRDMVGTYMVDGLFGEYLSRDWSDLRDEHWVKAEYVKVESLEWRPA